MARIVGAYLPDIQFNAIKKAITQRITASFA